MQDTKPKGTLGHKLKGKAEDEVLAFVPVNPKRLKATAILDRLLKAGYAWKVSTNRGKKNQTRAGMVRSVARYLDEHPKVQSVKEAKWRPTKLYYREIGT